MAKFLKSEKWKRRAAAGLVIALSATLSLGVFSACAKKPADGGDTEEDPALPTDTQLIKNGDFEFYSEKNKEDSKRRTFINSPTSWSANSESPASTSASGIINVNDWNTLSRSTFPLVQEADRKKTDNNGNEVDAVPGDVALTEDRKQYALDHWDEASLYDRLEFYYFFKITADSGFEKYDDYKYSIDFDDVRYLYEDAWGKKWDETSTEADNKIDLHYTESDPEEERGSNVLMIHNHHYTDTEKVSGTAKYYTSSTDVSLPAGTAAKVTVWVKTLNLTHYDKVPVEKRGGAYISVTNNVGSTALDQMQINDIITEKNADKNAVNNGWQQYTLYIRGNTFASTTFRIVLGLGRGTSDDRYEAVDGIALFDDLKCELIESDAFDTAVDEETTVSHRCGLDDKGDDRKFYSTDRQSGEFDTNTTYSLDLRAPFVKYTGLSLQEKDFDLTEEESGSLSYTSKDIDKSLNDNRTTVDESLRSILGQYTLGGLKTAAESSQNKYLKHLVEKDFADFPFSAADGDVDIVLLLSTNGAAYTAKLPEIEVGADSRKLISFWVKTSSILSGRSGAGATLVDGENKVSIAPFDSTTVATVDVDDETKDIWNGWVQCFFFVENDSDVDKSFTVELTYGPTSIADSNVSNYCEGYAAFANFETFDLTRAQYNYAATGTYAQKTTLTGAAVDPSLFDSAAASGNKLEEGLARPANYKGALAGSDVLVAGSETKNPTIKELNETYGIYTGLLSSEYADKYLALDANSTPWMKTLNGAAGDYNGDADTWWKNLFGSDGSTANAAYQPLVLLNTNTGVGVQPSYGFYAAKTNIAANASTKISVRVKVAQGTTAYICLIDVSGKATEGYSTGLKTTLPARTYWYDNDGNIVNMDPDSKDFDEKGSILFTLQENGLYKKAGDTTDTYYANLANFGKDGDNNLVNSNDTPVFYFDKETNAYYAYREEQSDGSYTYSTQVLDIPEDTVTRYSYDTQPEAVIAVEGTAENRDQWITVSFYVKAGNEAKDYRLELWAGSRDYKEGGEAKGFPNGGYVFFDRCSTSSLSNFDTLLSETEKSLLDYKDTEGNYPYRAPNPEYTEGSNLPKQLDDKLIDTLGRYYTFTLYDSVDYKAYDATKDENGDGNPWRKYVQSDNNEKLVYLTYTDMDGERLGTAFPTVSTFIDYSVSEQDLDQLKAPSLNDETDDDDSSSSTPSDTDGSSGNIWLILASALLAVAILFAIGAVVFRKLWSKRKKTAKVKAPKRPRAPKAAKAKEEAPATQEEPAKPAPEEKDENDPYNE